MAWADARQPGWSGRHVAGSVNLAGPTLGVPKALPALLSGETRDTAELGAVAALLADNFVSRTGRAALFRSWRGSLGMLMVGGPGVWGTPAGGAPDDSPEMVAAGISFGALVSVRGHGVPCGAASPSSSPSTAAAAANASDLTTLDAAEAVGLLVDALPAGAAAAVARSAAGVGVTRPALALATRAAANGSLPMDEATAAGVFAAAARRGAGRTCDPSSPATFDPLACPVIPAASAPATPVYCIYGTGKPTERAFRYAWDDGNDDGAPDWKIDTSASHPPPPALAEEGEGEESGGEPGSGSSSLPGGEDVGVARAARAIGGWDRGVAVSDGDGTVPLLSLATLCARGWAPGGPLNPGGARVTTREVRHAPLDALAALDLRGGGRSADHVDLLGHEQVLEDIVAIAAGKGGELTDRFVSRAREVAARVRLPTDRKE
jgi:phospholipid:diacylglycerol acyltransferase